MIRLIIIIYIAYLSAGCQLIDNSIKGQYGSIPADPVAAPVAEPIGLKLNLNECSDAPPEALSYSCSLLPETLYTQNSENVVSNITQSNLNSNSVASFELTQNSCTGLSLDSDGLLAGEIAKTVTETCAITIKAIKDGFTVEETLDLTVAPSLSFSFDRENVYVQEGQGEILVDLILSAPAPYDTFVEFDIYGDSAQILSGISFLTKKIIILKGQSSVTPRIQISSAT